MSQPPTAVLLVGVGGALGALARLAVARLVDADRYPLGTLAVNVAGSFALGLVAFSGTGETWSLLVGTGFCGAFTTFSSFAYETVRLAELDDPVLAGVNAVVNLVGALAGLALAAALVAGLF